MRKTALIVEPQFMQEHVGVRSYVLALERLLGRSGRVDLVSFYRSDTGRRQWYRTAPKDPRMSLDNGPSQDLCLGGSPAQVLRQFDKGFAESGSATPADFFYSQIGADLGREEYDVCVITNPWLVDFDNRLPAPLLAGIVYDIIPNVYAFTRHDKPFKFASEHERGYAYYRRHCDRILADSPETAEDFARYFKVEPERVRGLPPLAPASYFDVAETSNARNKNVALASPFDLRKGLLCMPAILNEAAGEIDTLSIYGAVRCDRGDVRRFFDQLRVRNVEWWPNAPASAVHSLFHNAKVLLFPSFHEGLGVPILEAQLCGCRVMVRDKPPMHQLALRGSQLLSGNDERDGELLARMLREGFDHARLQNEARSRFSTDHVLAVLNEALASTVPAERMGPQSRAA